MDINLIEVQTDMTSRYLPCENLNVFFEDIVLLDRVRDTGISAIFIVTKREERYMLEIHKLIKYDYNIFSNVLKLSGNEGFINIERYCISEYNIYKTDHNLIKSNYMYLHPGITINFNRYVSSNICAFTLFKEIQGYTLYRILPDLNTKELCYVLIKLLDMINTIKSYGLIYGNINKYNIICSIQYDELMSFLHNASSDNVEEYNKILNVIKDGIMCDEIVNILNNKTISEIYKKSTPSIKVTLLNNYYYGNDEYNNYLGAYHSSNSNADIIAILDILTYRLFDIKLLADARTYTDETMYFCSKINDNKIINSKYYKMIKCVNSKLTDKDNLRLFRASHTKDYMNIVSTGFIKSYKIEYRLPVTVINSLYQSAYSVNNCLSIINTFKDSIVNGLVTFNKTVINDSSKDRKIGVRKDLKLLV